MKQTILVADDEAKIVYLVASYLEASAYTVIQAFSGTEALRSFHADAPDCIILDINMPGMDGLSVAREIRKTSSVPILFLTARADETDRIAGFELGADDYIQKPFSPRELVARVKAVLRRTSIHTSAHTPTGDARLIRGSLVLDFYRRSLTKGGHPIGLTTAQFDILAHLMRECGRVWSRLEILEASSGSAFEGYERTVDAHIKNIRKILSDDSEHPRFIETVRGVGYRFMEQVDET